MIVMIDNFDSFTWNLVQYLMQLKQELKVVRNSEITLSEIEALKPSHIVISPGPGRPKNAGISSACIKEFQGKIPILGVCLGHQCLGEAFGASVVHAQTIMHGKTSRIRHQGKGVFQGIPEDFQGTRYHSLALERSSFPSELEIVAETEDGEIMGIQHCSLPLFGVQFHPESILSEYGFELLKNFTDV